LTYFEVKEVVKTAEDDGRKKEKIEIAQKLKQMSLTSSQIKEATGLSIREIDEL
jgi:predicted transposase/invertase (TIGR01784 family)